jgi:hypothetical protein
MLLWSLVVVHRRLIVETPWGACPLEP